MNLNLRFVGQKIKKKLFETIDHKGYHGHKKIARVMDLAKSSGVEQNHGLTYKLYSEAEKGVKIVREINKELAVLVGLAGLLVSITNIDYRLAHEKAHLTNLRVPKENQTIAIYSIETIFFVNKILFTLIHLACAYRQTAIIKVLGKRKEKFWKSTLQILSEIGYNESAPGLNLKKLNEFLLKSDPDKLKKLKNLIAIESKYINEVIAASQNLNLDPTFIDEIRKISQIEKEFTQKHLAQYKPNNTILNYEGKHPEFMISIGLFGVEYILDLF